MSEINLYRNGHNMLLVAVYSVLIILSGAALHVYAQGNGTTMPQSSQGPNIILLSQRFNDDTVVGEVMNNGSSVAESVKVTASFYDANNEIVAAKLTFADPSTLKPGDRATFNIYTSDEAIKQDAETYEFVLQWRDEDGVQTSKRVIAEEGSKQLTENESTESRRMIITILGGASVQGNPDFDPDNAPWTLGTQIVWQNSDNVPHTAASGTGPEDPTSGQIFDTGILGPGEWSKPQELAGVSEGDEVPYYCQIHPFMRGIITVVASSAETGLTSQDIDSKFENMGGDVGNRSTVTEPSNGVVIEVYISGLSNEAMSGPFGGSEATPIEVYVTIDNFTKAQEQKIAPFKVDNEGNLVVNFTFPETTERDKPFTLNVKDQNMKFASVNSRVSSTDPREPNRVFVNLGNTI